jgi:hypothetical protein
MSGWPILDVAIGLSFVYLLLSTICTSLTEGITTQLRSRPKYLARGITALIGDAAKSDFFSHPVITTFMNEEGDSVPRKVIRKIQRGLGLRSAITADKDPSYLPGDKFATVVYAMLQEKIDGRPKYAQLADKASLVLKNATSPDEQIKALHVWYDQVMERVSGWYKRHAQMWIRIVAIAVVVVLNADSTHIANLLWTDPTVRQIAVEQAKARLAQPPPQTASVDYSDTDESIPEEQPEQIGKPGDSSDKHLGLESEQWQLIYKLMSWTQDKADLAQQMGDQGTANPAGILASFFYLLQLFWFGLQRHWLGWLVTVIAVSLGAPFWFDALNRLVNIRNAGEPPAKKEPTSEKEVEEKKK